MSGRRKLIFLILALVICFVVWKIAGKHLGPVLDRFTLERKLSRIEPWPKTGDYSQQGWRTLLAVAKKVQDTKPQLVEEALARISAKYATANAELKEWQSGLYLLYCVLFDFGGGKSEENYSRLPLYVPPGQALSRWPIDWSGNKPTLVSGRPEVDLFSAPAERVFAELRYRFKYRDLDKVELK